MNRRSPRPLRGLPLVMSALMLMPLAADAGESKQQSPKPAAVTAAQPTPEEIQKQHAEIKARNKKIDEKQREEYLRAVPYPGSPGKDESDVVKMHSAREWYLLTYPTGTLPSQPKRRVRRSRMRWPP